MNDNRNYFFFPCLQRNRGKKCKTLSERVSAVQMSAAQLTAGEYKFATNAANWSESAKKLGFCCATPRTQTQKKSQIVSTSAKSKERQESLLPLRLAAADRATRAQTLGVISSLWNALEQRAARIGASVATHDEPLKDCTKKNTKTLQIYLVIFVIVVIDRKFVVFF